MPQLLIVRLANDGAGTAAGVADNDQALGMIVEGISKSKFWNETAIFVVEAWSQDASRRAPALVISPWVKPGQTYTARYTQASVLRTIETILGLRPLTVFDAAARPMFELFGDSPVAGAYVAASVQGR